MIRTSLPAAALAVCLALAAPAVHAQALGTAFTYQGELQQTGAPADGSYDFQFRLFDAPGGGVQIGPVVAGLDVSVRGGLFSLPLDFGAGQFAGDAQWLEIAVRPAGGGAFTVLAPRTPITPTPYALAAAITLSDSVTGDSIVAGSVGSAQINTAQVQARVSGSCPVGQVMRAVNQNGTVVCAADGVGSTGWALGGNAGIDPASQFLGTTDNAPLELRVDGVRRLRLEAGALAGSTNVIAGAESNSVLAGTSGTVVMGGGSPSTPNRVTDNFGTVGGGDDNIAGDSDGNALNATDATVSGGFGNRASGRSSSVGGGRSNVAGATEATTGGGAENRALASRSTVAGGLSNTASGPGSAVAGGSENTASGTHASVGGGTQNQSAGTASTVSGGDQNMADGLNSSVGGGAFNAAMGRDSTVAGGFSNVASGSAGTVAGGTFNTAKGDGSMVLGGTGSCAGGDGSAVGGTRAKVRVGTASTSSGFGCNAVAGSGDTDGDEGTFAWADSQNVDFTSTGPNQFLIRSAGGMAINTNAPRAPLTVTTGNKWNPTIGNGWGDFTVGDSTRGLAVGVSTGGGGAGSVRLWAKGGAENISFTNATLYPAQLLHIGGDGRVGVGRIAAANAFEVNGNASKSTAGDWLSNSDARIKTDVADIDSPVERLLRLRPVTFRYTEDYLAERPAIDDLEYYNVIAQEYAEVFPDAVKPSGEYLPGQSQTPENAVLQVDFHPASVLTVAAVQELAVRLAGVEAENAALRARLARIEARLGD